MIVALEPESDDAWLERALQGGIDPILHPEIWELYGRHRESFRPTVGKVVTFLSNVLEALPPAKRLPARRFANGRDLRMSLEILVGRGRYYVGDDHVSCAVALLGFRVKADGGFPGCHGFASNFPLTNLRSGLGARAVAQIKTS